MLRMTLVKLCYSNEFQTVYRANNMSKADFFQQYINFEICHIYHIAHCEFVTLIDNKYGKPQKKHC